MPRILIIDDDNAIQKMFKYILEIHKYEVTGVTNPEDAFQKYRELKPDLVIMDILMPGIDGIKLTKDISKYDKNARVVVVTAITKPGLEKACMSAGAKAFIMKPFNIDKLIHTIRRTIEG